jgi:aminopeptidase N
MRTTVLLLLMMAVAGLAQSEAWSDEPWLAGKPGANISSLTGLLPAESLHSYDVRQYRLDFDLPMTNAGYTCHEQIWLTSNEPSLDTFALDFAGLVCDSVRRNGAAIPFTTPSGLLRLDLDTPLSEHDSTLIDIFFHRESTASQIGFFFAKPPTVTHAHAMTCGCPRDNHYWFACWDWPYDKAERGCMINLTIPDTFQACANGLLDSVTAEPGSKKTWWWRHQFPICPYLMTFSASRFSRWDTIVTNPAGETVPLIYFMWPRDSAATRNGYRLVPDMMTYYADTNRFGPYPFERFGLVPGYYGFPWGGMEHQTQVMIHTSYMGGGGEATISHELSHMWWGDMVTHVGYADVWVNEGFGTWAECLYMGHLNGRTYYQSYVAGKASSYFSQHRSRDFPMYNPPWAEIYNGGIIYAKGSWVLRMLQFVEGDTAWENPDVFYRALRAYGDSFKYGTTSTADFQRINEQFSGLDLDWFFNEWVYDRGYPKYTITWDKQPLGDSWQVIATLSQRNDTNSARLFHMPYPIRFNCGSESTLVVFHPQDTIALDTFVMEEEPLSMTPDPDNWVLDSARVTGIEETPNTELQTTNVGPTIVRGVFVLPASPRPRVSASPCLLDACGRKVLDLHPGANDVSGLAPGVYFVRAVSSRLLAASCHKVVVAE